MPRAPTLSISFLERSRLPVAGAVSCVLSHASMAERSYVWPSMVKTGSISSSCVIGQMSDEAMPSSTSATCRFCLCCCASLVTLASASASALASAWRRGGAGRESPESPCGDRPTGEQRCRSAVGAATTSESRPLRSVPDAAIAAPLADLDGGGNGDRSRE